MLNDFKPVLKILLRFIVIYLVLLFVYQFYLNGQTGIDSFSRFVAEQVKFLQNKMGFITQLVDDKPEKETLWFFVQGRYISRMVEGCNAISVIILFLAFVFAFFKGAKTFVFALVGVLILHIMNVLRIVGLNYVLCEHPQFSKTAHDYLFPAVIYGTVVVLWLVWIKVFALKNENS